MKTWQYSTVTGTLEESLSFVEDAPMPDASNLRPDQLIIQVISAALNPVDYKLPESGLVGRIMIPRPATPGLDFCGRIYATHANNTTFKKGELVFGGLAGGFRFGTLGEYSVVSTAECARLPPGVQPDHAAAVGTAATTAYQSLPPHIVKPGAKVFINGGSGGVGTWAIQFAKVRGAHVVTTCSTRNIGRCKEFGADEVIDYTKGNIVDSLKAQGEAFDLIIDNVGDSAVLYDNRNTLLKPSGMFVQVGVGESLSIASIASTGSRQLWQYIPSERSFYFVNQNNKAEYFQQIGQWMTEGRVRAFVDTSFSLDRVVEAFKELRKGHVRDKLVIHVEQQTR
ncbi:related to zinc alcohol dehydrogenase [Fusarium oxysporum]|uniref:Related to zinc alcohol dehydrogenase n=1 Tax=Fusarium oxysporum TaxID=5507 RepID=A0A2H3TVG8_FUSOX|nr:related to zinc alcohol dehydrogenase [Fusarium oxysporum]